jgi:hypothetical protein
MTPEADEQLRFISNIQRILTEGSFVASYKYALIKVLADLAIERKVGSEGTLLIRLEDLAERFLEMYWRQVAPFRGRAALLQSVGRQAAIVTRIAVIRGKFGKLSEAKRAPEWRMLVAKTRAVLLEMPLWRLQRVGAEVLEFLYPNRLVDDGVLLNPGVAACFSIHFQLIQALVQSAWLRFIQRLPSNQELIGQGGDLAQFLFGADRSVLMAIGQELSALQNDRCFFCDGRMHGKGHVDHFIPWVRYQRDLGHNFVVAHVGCNGAKRDRLAALPHLKRWLERNAQHNLRLVHAFTKRKILFDRSTTEQVGYWSYEAVERSTGLVWLEGDVLIPLDANWQMCFPPT